MARQWMNCLRTGMRINTLKNGASKRANPGNKKSRVFGNAPTIAINNPTIASNHPSWRTQIEIAALPKKSAKTMMG